MMKLMQQILPSKRKEQFLDFEVIWARCLELLSKADVYFIRTAGSRPSTPCSEQVSSRRERTTCCRCRSSSSGPGTATKSRTAKSRPPSGGLSESARRRRGSGPSISATTRTAARRSWRPAAASCSPASRNRTPRYTSIFKELRSTRCAPSKAEAGIRSIASTGG